MLRAVKFGRALLTRFSAGREKKAADHQRLWDLALIGVFGLIVALPGLGMLLGLSRAFDPAFERRHPEPPPRIEMNKVGPISIPKLDSLRAFPVMFEPYFKDRHAFRREAMQAYLWSRVHGFTTVSQESQGRARDHDAKPGFESVLPSVILGKDGWLFYTGERSIEGCRRVIPMTHDQLERCRLDLEQKQARLKEHGIDFLLVIAPDKGTVYPECLPGYVRPTNAPSRLDQLLEHMRMHSTVRILDLRSALLRAKEGHQVFHRTDTHWNDLGAQAACRAMLEAMHHPSAARENLEQYRFVETLNDQGDERRALGGAVEAERTIYLEPRQPRAASVVVNNPGDWQRALLVSSNPQGTPLTPFVLSDSFHLVVAPFFNEYFQKSYRAVVSELDGQFPMDVIFNAKPDIVIHSLVERKLNLIE